MRRSSLVSCMIAPTMKAKRQSQTTSLVKPENTAAIGGCAASLPFTVQGTAWVTISNSGSAMPVMPTGIASVTHMMLAQTTMASTAMPSDDKPGGSGAKRMTKNRNQALRKPGMTQTGLRPDCSIFSNSGLRTGRRIRVTSSTKIDLPEKLSSIRKQ